MISNKLIGRYYRFWIFAKDTCFKRVLVRMIVWSSKMVFLSRKVFLSKNVSSSVCDVSQCWRLVSLSYAAFRARNVRGLEDVMRYCKGLVLTLRLRNILVCLRMFAAKIVVPVWIWFAIEELGPRGRVNLSPERGILLYCALWGVGLPRFLSCIFEDVSYSYRSSVTSFPYMPHFTSKTQQA